MDLNEIQKSLNQNSNLKDISECLMELIKIFNKNFPNVDLSTLNERLKTLIIKGEGKFVVKYASRYNPITNTIMINKSIPEKEKHVPNYKIDYKHILMRELIQIIFSKQNYTGFNVDNHYGALNCGYADRMANFLVGNEGTSEFENEIVASILFESIVGPELLQSSFMNGDNKCFIIPGVEQEIENFNQGVNIAYGLGRGKLIAVCSDLMQVAQKLGRVQELKNSLDELPAEQAFNIKSTGLDEFLKETLRNKADLIQKKVR